MPVTVVHYSQSIGPGAATAPTELQHEIDHLQLTHLRLAARLLLQLLLLVLQGRYLGAQPIQAPLRLPLLLLQRPLLRLPRSCQLCLQARRLGRPLAAQGRSGSSSAQRGAAQQGQCQVRGAGCSGAGRGNCDSSLSRLGRLQTRGGGEMGEGQSINPERHAGRWLPHAAALAAAPVAWQNAAHLLAAH
jgi:hypothetical protein